MAKIVIIGFGIQGKKRFKFFKEHISGIIDPYYIKADAKRVQDYPLSNYDTAFVCLPDPEKENVVK